MNSTLYSHDVVDKNTIISPIGHVGIMFYLVPPSIISTYEELKDVPPYVELAVPFFILFILAEILVAHLRGIRKTYDFKDTLTSFGSGAFQQVFGLFYKVLLIQPYIYVYNNYRLFKIDGGICLSLCLHAPNLPITCLDGFLISNDSY